MLHHVFRDDGLTVELMIQDRVDRFQKVVDQSWVSFIREQKARGRKCLEKLHEPGGSLHTDITEVRGDVGDTDGQRGEQGVQARCRRDRVCRLGVHGQCDTNEK